MLGLWGEVSPLEEWLGLQRGQSLTPALAEGTVQLGAVVPFAQSAALPAHFGGVDVGAETVRFLTEEAGAAQAALEAAAVAELEAAAAGARSTVAGTRAFLTARRGQIRCWVVAAAG